MKYTIFETFVGAGGSHIGFKKYNFLTKYVNDNNKDCLKTLLYNNPEIEKTAFVDNTSIIDIDLKNIMKKTKMKKGELDVLFGGIVCKGFSLAGERKPNDERNYFYHKQLEIVATAMPKVSVIENVPGFINATVVKRDTPVDILDNIDELWMKLESYKGIKSNLRKKNLITKEFEVQGKLLRAEKEEMLKFLKKNKYLINVIDDIQELYSELGYTLKSQVVNSALYGSATKRERIILVAVRNDIQFEYEFPEPTHIDPLLEQKYSYLIKENTNLKCVKTVNDALAEIDYTIDDIDNNPMSHNEKTVRRFKYIPEGESIANYIDQLPDDLKISKFYSRGNTMRLAGDKPSPTLVPGHSNFPVHPREHRSITVREAAMITGFPSDYKFFGNHSKRCEHVGNAVPPPLSEAIAKSIKELLDKYYSSGR
jgi:DNA (cytosine-5)-methyltransferase 1